MPVIETYLNFGDLSTFEGHQAALFENHRIL